MAAMKRSICIALIVISADRLQFVVLIIAVLGRRRGKGAAAPRCGSVQGCRPRNESNCGSGGDASSSSVSYEKAEKSANLVSAVEP